MIYANERVLGARFFFAPAQAARRSMSDEDRFLQKGRAAVHSWQVAGESLTKGGRSFTIENRLLNEGRKRPD
jgi:hypothetical protein